MRRMTTNATNAVIPKRGWAVRYETHGTVENVVRVVESPQPSLTTLADDQVLLRFLAAPINPADINMVEGVYHIRPPLPAVGGNEGVAQVVHVGSRVRSLAQGDWVIPSQPGFGTWRTFAVAHESAVDKVPNDIAPELAATLSVNPCTAYRMLNDFFFPHSPTAATTSRVPPDTYIIQNGATSAVGQAVIALARHIGARTINIIRPRPNIEATVARLTSLGADHVFTDDSFSSPAARAVLNSLPRPVLGLNCIGGLASADIARSLADGGTMITYGGMSKKPVQLPTGRLIFNDVIARGFWLSRWTDVHGRTQRQLMLDQVVELARRQVFRAECESVHVRDFVEQAMSRVREPYREKKVVLRFDDEEDAAEAKPRAAM